MGKGSQQFLKFKELVSEQRRIFSILYGKDAVDSLKYDEQPFLGNGNCSEGNPLVKKFEFHILK